MAMQVAYVLVTPYTIRKSRTGAVLARLLGRVSAELVTARMFAPTREFVEHYANQVLPALSAEDEKYRGLIRDYMLRNLTPETGGRRPRVLMLVFRGENAVAEIAAVVGGLSSSSTSGETIRDTFGDVVWNADGSIRYFEPCVLIANDPADAGADLRLWAEFSKTQPTLLTNTCTYEHPDQVQQTLTIIKPDSWRQQSSRPGAIIDMFSRTGLRIIGCKPCHLTVAQGMEFYGPVKDVLCRKLAPGIGAKARDILQDQLNIKLPPEVVSCLTEKVGVPFAEDQFEKIVEFMTGRRPSSVPEEEWTKPGPASCMVLVYEGEDAVKKIRDVLGPTDPSKAPSGTIRREFGSDIMVNTAHASDSPESFTRESRILRLEENTFAAEIEAVLRESRM